MSSKYVRLSRLNLGVSDEWLDRVSRNHPSRLSTPDRIAVYRSIGPAPRALYGVLMQSGGLGSWFHADSPPYTSRWVVACRDNVDRVTSTVALVLVSLLSNSMTESRIALMAATNVRCFLGHLKCGSYCVELIHALSCIFNPMCDGSPRQPQWCTLSKEKLCGETTAFPCKGYGECVLWEWLLDGRKDCIDGSDEDSDYIRTFEPSFQCYFNATGQSHRIRPINYSTPLVPLEIPLLRPPPVQPILPLFPPSQPILSPCIVCPSPPFPVGYPNAVALTTQNPFVTLIPNQIHTSYRPKDPFEDIGDIPTSHTSQTVPSSQITHGYTNEYPAKGEHEGKWKILVNGETSTSGLLGEKNLTNGIYTQLPLPSVITHIDLSSSSVNWEEISQSSTNKINTNQIESVSIFPDDDINKQEEQGTPTPIDFPHSDGDIEANVIYVKSTRSPPSLTSISKPELSSTTEHFNSYITPINPIIGILPPIIPVTLKPFNRFTQNPPYIQIPGTNSEEELIPIHTGDINPYEKIEVNTDRSAIFDRLFSRTTILSSPTVTTSSPVVVKITVDTISQTEENNEEATKPSSVTKLSLTTSTSTSLQTSMTSTITTSTENACLIEILEHSKSKYPQPLCDCQLGEIRINGTCTVPEQRLYFICSVLALATTIATFKMDFDEVCGYKEISTSDKRHLAFTRIRDSLPNPTCVRDTDNDNIVVNMQCANTCRLPDIQNLALKDSNKLYLAKIEAFPSLCSDDTLNYCHRYALCEVDQSGVQIKCECKPGTNDTSNGLGRTCEGIPLEDELSLNNVPQFCCSCIMLFGACLIFWLILLLGFLVLIPLLIYLFYHCCPTYKRNIVHPDREAFERADDLKNWENRPRSTMDGKNVAFIVAEALKSNARGTKALASSLTAVELLKKKGNAIKTSEERRIIEIESAKEVGNYYILNTLAHNACTNFLLFINALNCAPSLFKFTRMNVESKKRFFSLLNVFILSDEHIRHPFARSDSMTYFMNYVTKLSEARLERGTRCSLLPGIDWLALILLFEEIISVSNQRIFSADIEIRCPRRKWLNSFSHELFCLIPRLLHLSDFIAMQVSFQTGEEKNVTPSQRVIIKSDADCEEVRALSVCSLNAIRSINKFGMPENAPRAPRKRSTIERIDRIIRLPSEGTVY
uniref:EGF-like domain-containing protein n=1 Tax=Heterorhabditis bacteriophora TaxID=37862 RepID=A0A1I7WLD4_HETBA